MIARHSPEDLDRANIQMAWSFADRMTDEHFAQLCTVTVRLLGRRDDAGVQGYRDNEVEVTHGIARRD